MSATPVSIAMALAIVDEARAKDYSTGVIGLRGAPERALDVEVQHEGQLVRVRAAESALAMREVLAERDGADWLVVVTDRDDEDLGAGLLAHLVWQRLRSPDPWEAVRHRFAASGIDPALTQVPDSRELATGLLAAAPPGGWPAAPAGILTRNHAFSAVAAAHLDLESEAVDVLAVLRWTMRPGSVTAVATLRESMGDRLVDETLAWIARQAGSAAEPVLALLRQGDLTDVVPMGIVAELLTADLPAVPPTIPPPAILPAAGPPASRRAIHPPAVPPANRPGIPPPVVPPAAGLSASWRAIRPPAVPPASPAIPSPAVLLGAAFRWPAFRRAGRAYLRRSSLRRRPSRHRAPGPTGLGPPRAALG